MEHVHANAGLGMRHFPIRCTTAALLIIQAEIVINPIRKAASDSRSSKGSTVAHTRPSATVLHCHRYLLAVPSLDDETNFKGSMAT